MFKKYVLLACFTFLMASELSDEFKSKLNLAKLADSQQELAYVLALENMPTSFLLKKGYDVKKVKTMIHEKQRLFDVSWNRFLEIKKSDLEVARKLKRKEIGQKIRDMEKTTLLLPPFNHTHIDQIATGGLVQFTKKQLTENIALFSIAYKRFCGRDGKNGDADTCDAYRDLLNRAWDLMDNYLYDEVKDAKELIRNEAENHVKQLTENFIQTFKREYQQEGPVDEGFEEERASEDTSDFF